MKPPARNSNPIGQSRRGVLREAIAREEARLDRLEAARADVRNQLAALRANSSGMRDRDLVVVVYTEREEDRIRIIGARLANKREQALYRSYMDQYK